VQVVEDELVDGRYSVAIGVDQPDELVNLAARDQSDDVEPSRISRTRAWTSVSPGSRLPLARRRRPLTDYSSRVGSARGTRAPRGDGRNG
jgi:hypothetical protein